MKQTAIRECGAVPETELLSDYLKHIQEYFTRICITPPSSRSKVPLSTQKNLPYVSFRLRREVEKSPHLQNNIYFVPRQSDIPVPHTSTNHTYIFEFRCAS